MGIIENTLKHYTFPSYFSARFRRFVTAALLNEGGFANDPDDAGGKTILGIASRYWKKDYEVCMSYWRDGKIENAIDYAMEFYHTHFYSVFFDKLVDESLAFKLFDFGINADPKVATKALQVVLNTKFLFKLKVDGILGGNTVSAVNQITERSDTFIGETKLYEFYVLELKEYYEGRSTFWKFGKGWFHRLRKIYNESKVEGKVNWSFVKTRAF